MKPTKKSAPAASSNQSKRRRGRHRDGASSARCGTGLRAKVRDGPTLSADPDAAGAGRCPDAILTPERTERRDSPAPRMLRAGPKSSQAQSQVGSPSTPRTRQKNGWWHCSLARLRAYGVECCVGSRSGVTAHIGARTVRPTSDEAQPSGIDCLLI